MISVSETGARTLTVSRHDRDCAGLTHVYPVLSRRAGGVSVGINLNPNQACNWHCVYCQVPGLVRGGPPAIDLRLLERELRGFLHDLVHGDWLQRFAPEGARVIRDLAFSGNGEPTAAAEFAAAVSLVVRLRSEFGLDAGEAPVALRLITNGSLMARPQVQQGIRQLAAAGGEVWFKLDAGTRGAIERINGVRLEPARVVRDLACCAQLCRTWVQTCMFRWDGAAPAEAELDAWLDVLQQAGPERLAGVLLYGLARPSMQPEASRLTALTADELQAVAARIRQKGLTVLVSP
jgi:wyosine [tRNA(Phe)-imidazoG37] synthetase (radical SAM superfamily)